MLATLMTTTGLGNYEDPIIIYGDNAACLALCALHQVTAKAKHIDVIDHFAKEQLGSIAFNYVAISLNVSDILTKALFKPLMGQHRLSLGLQALEG